MAIRAAPGITIDEEEIQEEFFRASGPGGQHVNKACTAVRLKYDVVSSPSLPESVRLRLLLLAGSRITEDGILIIEAGRFRSQSRNRRDAMGRLIRLIRCAAEVPKARRKARPTRASEQRRLAGKRRLGEKKKLRQVPPDEC